MAYSGKFLPKNIKKYRGNVRNITYRSLWELHMFKWCDNNNEVIRWSSEEIVIPYFSTADGKRRRYFMDLYVEMADVTYLFEIKPFKETIKPKTPSRLTSKAKMNFMKENYTYDVNMDKWQAARIVAEKKGWVFKIITEKTLKSHFGWKG